MKRISLGNRLTPYLLLTCLVLAAIVAVEWRIGARTGIEGPAEAPPAAAAEAPPARTAFVAPGIEAFGEILERPLFTAGREPPEEPAVAAPTTAAIPTAADPPASGRRGAHTADAGRRGARSRH